jgi:hypothetical protein
MTYEYNCEHLYTTPEKLPETIEQHGVAIIPNILNTEECVKMGNDMCDYLEYITQKWNIPINRNNENT